MEDRAAQRKTRTTPRTSRHLSIDGSAESIHALIVGFGRIVGNQLSIADDDSGGALRARIQARITFDKKSDGLGGIRGDKV